MCETETELRRVWACEGYHSNLSKRGCSEVGVSLPFQLVYTQCASQGQTQYRFSERVTKGTQVILKVTKDGKGSVEFEKPSSCDSQSLAVLHTG